MSMLYCSCVRVLEEASRGVAQLVARMVWDHEVRGSSPRTPTIPLLPCRLSFKMFSGSNSVVEFLPSKQAVAGSSPVSRSKQETVSLQALLAPVENNQPARGKASRRFCFWQKCMQRHTAFSGTRHTASPPTSPCGCSLKEKVRTQHDFKLVKEASELRTRRGTGRR